MPENRILSPRRGCRAGPGQGDNAFPVRRQARPAGAVVEYVADRHLCLPERRPKKICCGVSTGDGALTFTSAGPIEERLQRGDDLLFSRCDRRQGGPILMVGCWRHSRRLWERIVSASMGTPRVWLRDACRGLRTRRRLVGIEQFVHDSISDAALQEIRSKKSRGAMGGTAVVSYMVVGTGRLAATGRLVAG